MNNQTTVNAPVAVHLISDIATMKLLPGNAMLANTRVPMQLMH